MQKIFIVEDEDNIREMVIYALKSAGFEAIGYSGSGGLFSALRDGLPALVLLDIMLPGEDGLAILRRLRQNETTRSLPVIMMTAKGSEYDRVRGLDMGADDYITKPFSIMEAISRIRAVLRRCGEGDGSVEGEVSVGGITLNRDRRVVTADGAEIALTYKEFELLYYLMANPGIVLTRDRLLEQIWGFDYNGESRTVDMHIKSLRQKLGESGGLITTVRNVGYKIGSGASH